jgi:salicylate hydroxylase
MAPNAHMVHYPVMGGRAMNVVAVITEQFNKVGWTNPGKAEELLYHYNDWHETPRNFLHSISGWEKWALFGLAHLPRWSHGRVVLLGDAAHPPIPFLAQGGVMAIEDAFVIGNELARHGDDYGAAFSAYEKLRRDRAYRVMDEAHKLGKIYHMKNFMRRARNTVLRHRKPASLLIDYDWLYGYRFPELA